MFVLGKLWESEEKKQEIRKVNRAGVDDIIIIISSSNH